MKIVHRHSGIVLFDSNTAYLSGANLSGANLRDANLTGADLRGANLSGAYLRDANLTGADLRGANLRGAYLSDANLRDANLRDANLTGADLRDADLRTADLSDANLSGANLRDANLRDACLGGAKNVDTASTWFKQTRILPDEGAIVGWKKCRNNVLIKLLIPEDAARSHAFGRKCRASKAQVLEVIGGEIGTSLCDGATTYTQGQLVLPDKFDLDWTNECASGIHFFITRKEAEDYGT